MVSKIEWTDQSANPIKEVGGGNYCIPISPGCKNCFASCLNSKGTRFGGNGKPFGVRPEGHPEMTLNTEMLAKWSRMRKPKKHFVGSMTDIFGEWVRAQYICEMLDNMRAAHLQTFQLLTKRPERLPGLLEYWLGYNGLDQLPANIWIGTSAENQEWLDKRLIWLIRAKAQVSFLSLEPLLGPIYMFDVDGPASMGMSDDNPQRILWPCDMIDWVIIGGESGPGGRSMDLQWVADILDQCREAGIPAFVKQLGSHWARRVGAKHKKGGDPNEWPEWARVRMFPGEVWG